MRDLVGSLTLLLLLFFFNWLMRERGGVAERVWICGKGEGGVGEEGWGEE